MLVNWGLLSRSGVEPETYVRGTWVRVTVELRVRDVGLGQRSIL